MRNERTILAAVLIGAAALWTSGCEAHAQASGTAAAAPVTFQAAPMLVAVDSGVWVVQDSDRAVYYVDDYYWVYKDETWYRSHSYDGGWTVIEVSVVPGVIVNRTHSKFAHYHGDAMAQTKPAPKGGDTVVTTSAPADPPAAGNPHGEPPGHDAIPGVGNQRKAEGEQPGRAPIASATPPGMTKGADGADATTTAPKPGDAKDAATAKPKKDAKKDLKKDDKK